jgi:hypothetical protein
MCNSRYANCQKLRYVIVCKIGNHIFAMGPSQPSGVRVRVCELWAHGQRHGAWLREAAVPRGPSPPPPSPEPPPPTFLCAGWLGHTPWAMGMAMGTHHGQWAHTMGNGHTPWAHGQWAMGTHHGHMGMAMGTHHGQRHTPWAMGNGHGNGHTQWASGTHHGQGAMGTHHGQRCG